MTTTAIARVNAAIYGICMLALAVGCSKESSPASAPSEQRKEQKVVSPPIPKKEEPREDSKPNDQAKPQAEKQEEKPKVDQQAEQPAEVAKPADSSANSEAAPKPEEPSKNTVEQPAPSVQPPVTASEPTAPAKENPVAEAPQPAEESLAEKIAKASKELGFEILVAHRVSLDEAAHGLQQLQNAVTEVKKRKAEASVTRIEPLFDLLVLDHKNEASVERHGKLRVRFDVSQQPATAAAGLQFQYASCLGESKDEAGSAKRLDLCKNQSKKQAVQAFREKRSLLQETLPKLSPLKVDCGSVGVERCAIGAKNLSEALPLIAPNIRDSIKSVKFIGRNPVNLLSPISFSEGKNREVSVSLLFSETPAEMVDLLK